MYGRTRIRNAGLRDRFEEMSGELYRSLNAAAKRKFKRRASDHDVQKSTGRLRNVAADEDVIGATAETRAKIKSCVNR